MNTSKTRNLIIISIFSALTFSSLPISFAKNNAEESLAKAFKATEKAVNSNTALRVESSNLGTRDRIEYKIVNLKTAYSLDSENENRIVLGSRIYNLIIGNQYSTEELSKVKSKYPKAKYTYYDLRPLPLAVDSVTFMAGYVVEIAKEASSITSLKNGKMTEYSFKNVKIKDKHILSNYKGFSKVPVKGYIKVDGSGRISEAYATTADGKTSIKTTYTYGKVKNITPPKKEEIINQDEFLSLLVKPSK